MSQLNDPCTAINALNQGSTVLFNAVKNNDVLEVKRLLSLGADIEKRHIEGYTPLSWACFHSKQDSYFDTIEILLKNGANVNDTTAEFKGEDTPLCRLIFNDNVKTVKLLLNYGPDLKIQNSSGKSPLCVAVRRRRFEMVKLLLDHGADVNLVNPKNGRSPLHVGIEMQFIMDLPDYLELGEYCPRDLKLVQLILDHGADVNAINPICDGSTPLHRACRYGNLKMIKLLLRYGADIHARENKGRTPVKYLLQEFSCSSKKILLFLLQHSDVNSVDSKGDSILYSRTDEYFEESFDKVILEHIAVLVALNLPVSSNLKDIISDNDWNDRYCDHFEECCDELMTAKNTKLKNSWVTFFNLLVDGRKKLKNYAGNEDLVNDFKNSECSKKFEIYGALMQKNMEKGIKRRELFDKSTVSLTDCLPIFNPTHIIIRDILDCVLSKKDLSKLCQ